VQSNPPAQGHAPGVATRAESRNGRSYLIGFAFALVLTAASFWASSTSVVYARAVPILIAVLAVAQMGVHVAFFLHISSAPDQENNLLALAFGVFITALVVFGSLIIMTNLNHNMVSATQLMQMQR
jgi:cytochrome o ubiquinol oxidase operon protein cyoD